MENDPPAGPPPAPLAVGLVALAATVTAAVLWWGGAIRTNELVKGILDVDATWSVWTLPAARLATHAAAVVTVGLLLAAGFLVAGRRAEDRLRLAPPALRRVRAAGWSALVWAMAALVAAVLTVLDLVGSAVTREVFHPLALGDLLTGTPVGRSLLAVLLLAGVVAVAAQYIRTVAGAVALLPLAVLAAVPPAFAGHGGGSVLHGAASSSLVLHVAAAVLWVGGLLALLLTRRLPVPALAAAVRRFSRLALWCFVVVAVTGALGAVVRLGNWPNLASPYGLVVLAKVGALGLLGWLGWAHRRRSLPALAAGRRAVFTRIAAVEALVMAAGFGLAAGLARTPPPTDGLENTPGTALWQVLYWLPDPLLLTAATAGVGGYLAGARRLRGGWPAGRTAAWVGGWLLLLAATALPLVLRAGDRADAVLLVQHAVLVTAVPVLFVGAAPLRLARRVLRPAVGPDLPGPREWLAGAGAARLSRVLADPTVATVLFAAGLYAAYASAVYAFPIQAHPAHLATVVGAVATATGYVRLVAAAPARTVRLATVGTAVAMLAVLGWAATRPVPPADLTVLAGLVAAVVGLAASAGRGPLAVDAARSPKSP